MKPGLFLAAPFTAALFHDFTRGFDVAFLTRSRLKFQVSNMKE
jgi:hypothetical protein